MKDSLITKIFSVNLKEVFIMKKVFSFFMILTLLFSLVACGNSTTNEESSSFTQQSNYQNSIPDRELNNQNHSSTPTAADSKSLDVYFFWSGNTKNVAKSIQSQTDSDI